MRRGKDMEMNLYLPLRDFYTGRTVEFSIEKQSICESCEGSGSEDGVVDTCGQCGGGGFIVRKHVLAPGMIQQVQMPCDRCGGRGQSIRHVCKVCGGARVVRGEVTLTGEIVPGMGTGSKLVFENEGNESPDWIAGDVVVHLAEEEPRRAEDEKQRTDGTFFRRKGKDLFWKEVLGLREAWMGDWTRNITHLDGHVIRIGRERGHVVQPLSVEKIPGKGMPIYHPLQEKPEENVFGDLYVEYVVVLPDKMASGMEKDFWAMWEKWRRQVGVNLGKELGPDRKKKDEL